MHCYGVCLISAIPAIEIVGTYLISVFVDSMLLSPTSPALVQHQDKIFARRGRSDEGPIYGQWGPTCRRRVYGQWRQNNRWQNTSEAEHVRGRLLLQP
jgi:hypothetical protein